MSIGATERIARFAIEKSFDDIPHTPKEEAKMAILDWFAVILATLKEAENSVNIMLDLISLYKGEPVVKILGSEMKTNALLASLANGYIGHILDYDTTNPTTRSHLTAAALPAVLALGEERRISGEKLLESLIIGYEVSLRVGEALHPEELQVGWHGTGIFGPFGAVVGAGKILGLDLQQMWMAIAIAASMPSGIARNFGTLTKPLHAGLAAKNGILAASLAARGFTGAKDALEGPLGYYRAYDQIKEARLETLEQLGNPWGLETRGQENPKLYPCCHGLATNCEYAILIKNRYQFSPEDIEGIEIYSQPKTLSAMFSTNYIDTGETLKWGYEGPPRQLAPAIPKTVSEAKFCKEFAFAKAILDGKIGLATFTDEQIKDAKTQELMKKTKVYHDARLEKLSNEYPEVTWPYGERMVIKLKDGRKIEEEEIFIQGAAKRPLSIKEVREKFDDCASYAGLSEERRDKIASMIESLEEVKDISELTALV